MPIKVKIVQLGKGVLLWDLEDPTPVEASLVKLGITGGGMDLHVNGRPAQPTQKLQDGDLVTIIPRIKGGHHTKNQRR
jgi:sulfur carrier protein ThiS